MNKVAYLFPGQGSQSVGMGRGLFERFPHHTTRASDLLGYRIDTLCLEDPDKQLGQTQFTQPALYVVGALGLLEQFENDDAPADALAGHSLGEYVALFAAGAFDFETGLTLVQERARLMGEVAGSGMAAVTKMSVARLSEVLASEEAFSQIDIANHNTHTQTVVSGDLTQLRALGDRVRVENGEYFPLRVSAAFHSRYMRDAQQRFASFAASVAFRPTRVPVIANVTAQPYPDDGEGIRALLVSQISSPVRWLASMQWLLRAGVDRFMELGPGKVLTRMVESIVKIEQESTPPPSRPPAKAPQRPKPIFLCPGQGGQHFRMGQALYEKQPSFRAAFDECAALSRPMIGESIVDLVYAPNDPTAEFSRTLHTHLANFAFGYSMLALLRAEGTEPSCLVGWSLGEYVALTAAGALTLQQALTLVARQAQLIEAQTQPASMLAVLENVNIYYSLDRVFYGTALGGIHTDQGFVITAPAPLLETVAQILGEKGISTHRLPVSHGFHSALLDPICDSFNELCAGLTPKPLMVPLYSSAQRMRVESVEADYLWRICRSRFNFRTALMQATQQHPGASLIDIGPTGTSALHATMILGRGADVLHAARSPRAA